MYLARKVFKFIRRFLYFFLSLIVLTVVVFVCFNKPKEVKAEAVAIVGAIAVAGLTAFMASAGVKVAGSNIDGSTFQEAIENVAKDFTFDNKKLSDFYNDNNAVNFLIGKDGAKKVAVYSTVFANWCEAFKDYFIEHYNLRVGTPEIIVSNQVIELPDGNYPFYSDFSGFTNGKVPISIAQISPSMNKLIPVTDNISAVINTSEVFDVGGVDRINVSLGYYNISEDQYYIGWSNQRYAVYNGSWDYVKVCFSSNTYNNQLMLVLLPVGWNQTGSYNGSSYTATLPIPLSNLDKVNIGVTGELTEGYDDFAQALEDAKTEAGTGANAKVGANVGVGDIPIDRPYTQENIAQGILDAAGVGTLTGELTGGYENEKEAEEENDVEKAPTVPELQQGVVLVNGLEDFFPFCIPFDLYELIKLFNVAPRAPEFDVNIGFGSFFEEETIHLDFSEWETAANIFRILIVIGFTLFLIMKTRDLIRG